MIYICIFDFSDLLASMKASDFQNTPLSNDMDQILDLASSLTSMFSRSQDSPLSVDPGLSSSMDSTTLQSPSALDSSGTQLYSLSAAESNASTTLTGLILSLFLMSMYFFIQN